ncbi:MAG: outer membrane lipid asymmetry maintenance protein MlaD [Gammaproteobacteria bacterium]
MRQSSVLEVTTGLFVVLGIAALFYLATQTTDYRTVSGSQSYIVRAYFNNVGGLHVGAPVQMGGVTVGRVVGIHYSMKRYQAVIRMALEDRDAHIPSDSTASILTQGVLGQQYVGISPGGAPTFLKNGSTIHFTQSAIILEHLLGQLLTHGSSGKGK